MLTYPLIRALAEQYVTKHYPIPLIQIRHEEPIRQPYGWYFSINAKQPVPGLGGVFVDGQTGEMLALDSSMFIDQGLEYWLALHHRGFRSGPYRLTIHCIANLSTTVEGLAQQELLYIIPRIKGDTIWRASSRYTNKLLHKRLQELPCIFETLGMKQIAALEDRLAQTQCCEFSYERILEAPDRYEWRADQATAKDLQPIW